jgi:hypothetical protein
MYFCTENDNPLKMAGSIVAFSIIAHRPAHPAVGYSIFFGAPRPGTSAIAKSTFVDGETTTLSKSQNDRLSSCLCEAF